MIDVLKICGNISPMYAKILDVLSIAPVIFKHGKFNENFTPPAEAE
jgi:hypothetical protein